MPLVNPHVARSRVHNTPMDDEIATHTSQGTFARSQFLITCSGVGIQRRTRQYLSTAAALGDPIAGAVSGAIARVWSIRCH